MLKRTRDRYEWYARRLASMGMREIGHRLVEGTRKQIGRRHNLGWEEINISGELTLLPDVRRHRWLEHPEIAAAVRSEAVSTHRGSFQLLGAKWPAPTSMPPPTDYWHTDPIAGTIFPYRDHYCFDIPFRDGINQAQLKRIWELNRLQFLLPVAVDAAAGNDARSVEFVFSIIESWMEANPPFRGPNWAVGIELGLRVISISLAVSILGPECLNETRRTLILRFLFAHVDWLRRFPSLYSSANNHRIAELAGIVVGTTLAPGFPGADVLQRNSWRSILLEMNRQIYSDGVGAEQAPGYTALSIELFRTAALALNLNDRAPESIVDRLAAWAEHSLWMMDSGGRVPAIGDCDDSRVIATKQEPESRYLASIVAMVAGWIGQPDLAPPAKDSSLRDVILGTTDARENKRAGIRSFTAGGYSVVRGSGNAPPILAFDHGPIGHLSIAAHGHADSLAIWLTVGDQPVIVDAGTFLYSSDRSERNQFRETAVHNTLCIGDTPSSRPAGPFNWATKADAHLFSLNEKWPPQLVAEHDGYVRRYGVRHRRTVSFDGVARFVIMDELIGRSAPQNVSIAFLLHPMLSARRESGSARIMASLDSNPIIRLWSDDGLKPEIIRAGTRGRGWVSPSLGIRVPSDQIIFRGCLSKTSLITIDILHTK